MIKRILSSITLLLLVSFVFIILPSCSAANHDEQNSESSNIAQKSHEVIDAYGRSVTVPEAVSSVATVGSGARFVTYAGGVEKLIAITDKELAPNLSIPYTVVHQELFSKLPSTSNGNHLNETDIDVEALLNLEPDVIISSRSAQECDKLFEATGIPVIGISYQDQIFSDSVYQSIEAVGRAIGTEEHAQSTIAAMKGWKEELDTMICSALLPSRTAYIGALNYKGSKGITGTCGKYPPFEAAHVTNVADEANVSGSFDTTLEQLGVWNPEAIFFNGANRELILNDYFQNKAFCDELDAFKNDMLFTQPSFNYNGTNVEIGVCSAFFSASMLYPEAFKGFDLRAQYDEVLSVMLGSSCYDQLEQAGLGFGVFALDESMSVS